MPWSEFVWVFCKNSALSSTGHHRIGSTGGPDLLAQSGKVPGTMLEVLLQVLGNAVYPNGMCKHDAFTSDNWIGCHQQGVTWYLLQVLFKLAARYYMSGAFHPLWWQVETLTGPPNMRHASTNALLLSPQRLSSFMFGMHVLHLIPTVWYGEAIVHPHGDRMCLLRCSVMWS
jgi:hypothetical protein